MPPDSLPLDGHCYTTHRVDCLTAARQRDGKFSQQDARAQTQMKSLTADSPGFSLVDTPFTRPTGSLKGTPSSLASRRMPPPRVTLLYSIVCPAERKRDGKDQVTQMQSACRRPC